MWVTPKEKQKKISQTNGAYSAATFFIRWVNVCATVVHRLHNTNRYTVWRMASAAHVGATSTTFAILRLRYQVLKTTHVLLIQISFRKQFDHLLRLFLSNLLDLSPHSHIECRFYFFVLFFSFCSLCYRVNGILVNMPRPLGSKLSTQRLNVHMHTRRRNGTLPIIVMILLNEI